MSERPYLRELSRAEIHKGSPYATTHTHEEIQSGCLQRLADATEKMAQRYTDLIDERDRLKRREAHMTERCHKLERRLSAKNGVITRLKRERAELKSKLEAS